jgi:hypothetical protein
MANQRIIQCIGTSEEDMAHMRLLLRVAKAELRDSWSWGSESKADLVVVDARRLIGSSAMRRAIQRGVVCAQVIEENDARPAGQYLRRPFKRAAFVTLLNETAQGTAAVSDPERWNDEFFDLDLGAVDLSKLEAEHPGAQAFASNPAEGADKQEARESMPSADAPANPVTEESARDRDADSTGNAPAGAASHDAALDAAYGEDAETHLDKDATYPLIYYLERGVLRGPVRIELPGAPALVLDPDEQVFLARGLLRMLEPYASEPLRFGDFKRLTHSELEVVRRTASARPYVRLIWMDSFLHSDGFLAKHLDPGGTYRLTDRLELTGDYPRAFRVGTHMTVPRKLHEIARLSAVGLAEVFDVVNAYESIGYVEWTTRERK